MATKEILILYGSQTGNSEDIAKDLFVQFQEKGIKNIRCQTLNSIKGVDLKVQDVSLIIVCSTTGNGDPPENADLWWRSVKLRSAPKDLFLNIPYTVLGLGDSNYDKFCHVGKLIDKRIGELGGNRFLPLTCADEGVGLEETVEAWKITTISTIFSTFIEHNTSHNPEEIPSPQPSKLTDESITNPEVPQTTSNCKIQLSMSEELMNFNRMIAFLNLQDQFMSPPKESEMMKQRSESLLSFDFIDPSIEQDQQRFNSTPAEGWTVESPFTARVDSARWLTVPPSPLEDIWEVKQVVLMTINLGDSGISYLPGDSIGIICPNPSYLVDIVLRRLRERGDLPSPLLLSTLIHDSHNFTYTLEELLTYRVDLTSIPRRAALMSLAAHCRDPQESAQMQWLCSKGEVGKLLWAQFFEAQRLGVGELLALFPSCCPPLNVLVNCAGRLPPRFYSVASSQEAHPSSLNIAFSVVKYTCSCTAPGGIQGPPIRRRGVCTSYLENTLSPFLCSNTSLSLSSLSPQIKIFPKPTITFRLPGSCSIPLILVGPGTGVAPFIGFLEHRSQTQIITQSIGKTTSSGCWRGGFDLDELDLPPESDQVKSFLQAVPAAPIYLFFGCQGPHDFLFRENLEQFLSHKTLSVLEVAMSRVTAQKVYVSHKILERGAEVADLILNKSAHVFVCGDGVKMAKDVQRAFKQVLVRDGGMSETTAEELLADMKHRRRYLQDVWS